MRRTPIGIAMLNDERKHIWEKNNPQNMAVVNRWAEVIREDFKNAEGAAPQVVVGSKIITGVRAAQEVGEALVRQGCRQIIICYNVWNYPFLVWPLVNCFGADTPILSLSNNNGQYPGNVGLLATDGALRQVGRRTHRIVGEIDDPATRAALMDWTRASEAVTTIKNEVYGLYGGHSMGMETGFFHLTPLLKSLGCTTYQIDQLQLVKYAEQVPESESEAGLKWFEGLLGDRLLYDGKALTPESLKRQIRIYLAMEKVNQEEGFDFCGLKGQRELTDYVAVGDVPEMLMNDPYDWRGPKEPTVCATEADSLGAVTMQLLKYVSGGLPSLFMDVRLYHPDIDVWDWCNSGQHASWYAAQSFDPAENFKKITFHPALAFYFPAGGASVEFDAAPGEMTFTRMGLWDERPYMVIVKGESLDLPAEQRKALNAETDPTWPHVHARLECSFEECLAAFPANHMQGTTGDRVRALTYLCEIAGITPIVLGESGERRVRPIWERV